MYCISAIMGMVAIMVVKRELVEAVVLTVVAAILLCVFVADHPRLRDIMQEGISAVPKTDGKKSQAAQKIEEKEASADAGNEGKEPPADPGEEGEEQR